jgi:cell division protein FtsI (penicillin-binding protein 3)
LTTILQKSSNVGISKVITQLNPDLFYSVLARFGFAESTGSGFPGERSGTIVRPLVNDKFSLATQSFGYGLSITPIQLAQAYAAIASGGIRYPVTFLKQSPDAVKGKRVITPEISDKLLTMLASVTGPGGSATKAKIPGYQVVGKTSTIRKLSGAGGYDAHRYMSAFTGIAPRSKPRIVIMVMLDEPNSGIYYGGAVAAPVFAKILAGTVRLLNIPPDDLEQVRSSDAKS